MVFNPYERISKTWEVRNSGSCSWDSTYRLVLTGGEAMGYQGPFPIPQPVAPGETVLLTADLVAPEGDGFHESDFMLLSPQGELFGVGAFGGGRLAVVVQVVEQPINILYDFSQMACEAAWESDEDALPCPGNLYDDAGFVLTLQGSDLESGTTGPHRLVDQSGQSMTAAGFAAFSRSLNWRKAPASRQM